MLCLRCLYGLLAKTKIISAAYTEIKNIGDTCNDSIKTMLLPSTSLYIIKKLYHFSFNLQF